MPQDKAPLNISGKYKFKINKQDILFASFTYGYLISKFKFFLDIGRIRSKADIQPLADLSIGSL